MIRRGVSVGTRRALMPLLLAAIAFTIMAGLCTATRGDVLTWCSNIGSLLLAVGATVGCALAARRTRQRLRRGWSALAVACGCWAAGQVAWTVLESALGEATPYPSPADIGYVAFIPAALLAFGWLPPPASRAQLARRWLDGLTVGVAFLLVAWLLVLKQVASRSESLLATTIGLAYPVGDIVLLTVAGLTIVQSHRRPDGWRRLAAAALAMLYSDGAFAYLTATDSYESGGLPDWGWWAAFCLFAVAGIRVRPEQPITTTAPDPRPENSSLPAYATLGVPILAVVAAYGSGVRFDATAGALTVVLVLLGFIRQFVGLRENRRLRRAVQAREVQLNRLAYHDALTGLPNHALFLERLGRALDLAAREQHPVSVLFCDLDGFKAVNDSLGHAMGDRLLVAVAQRFSDVLRDTDTLARLGGDELAVLVEHVGGEDRSVEAVAQALRRMLDEPFVLVDRTVSVSASIGTATSDPRRTAETATALLHRADIAMYRVKTSVRGPAPRVEPGGPATNGDLSADDPVGTAKPSDVPATVAPAPGRHHTSAGSGESDRLAGTLADALDQRAIRAVYQPVVDTVTGRIMTLEVLARWTHEGRVIGPDVFVPIAERNGLSSTLTALMLDQACAQLGTWSRQLGHQRLRVAVNVSPTDLLDAELPLRVARHVEQSGLDPAQVALEITETEMWRPDEVLDVLHALRARGVRIAIDDFGTGHSSLSRLATLPLDTLKIDQTFVADIDHDVARLRFLAGMLDFGRHLGLRTIAEGVERTGQLLALRRLRCDLVQGYLTGRPAAPETLTPLILSDATLLPFALQPSWRSGGANAVGPAVKITTP